MSQDKRIQIEAMRRAGLIDQEEYNEMIGALDVYDAQHYGRAKDQYIRELVEKYTQWKQSVDQHLSSHVEYNLAQAKLMVPSLENITGDMYRAGDSSEDASHVVLSTIEDNQ